MMRRVRTPQYQLLDHTADIGMVVYGTNFKELYSNSAFAMFDLITDTSRVKPKNSMVIEVEGNNPDELMVNWLSELLYVLESRSLLLIEFDILEIDRNRLKAEVRGEHYDPARHEYFTEIKAATYHQLKVEKVDERWKAQIIFDT